MPSLARLGMIGLDALQWPITVRFNLACSWGISSQELTLNVPELANNLPAELEFVKRIWAGFIATAITRNCQLSFTEVVRWKVSPLPFLGATGAPAGASGLAPARQDESGVIILHTGHADRYSRRKFFVPNMPRNWQTSRVLNDAGQTGLYALCAQLFMGLGAGPLSSAISWLIAYPRVVEPDASNLIGVAFRQVQWVRICSYCDKAPDEVPLDWP